MSEKSFGFIGAGNMAGAILKGILSKGYITTDNIYIYDIDSNKLDYYSKYSINTCDTANELVSKCDFIFLCVKPQSAPECLGKIKSCFTPGKCVISIMAGMTIKSISELLDGHKRIIRIMPNTPLMVGMGASALVHVPEVPDDEFETVRSIFDLSGKTVVVGEDKLSAVTAVSGSGPAYFFKFVKAALEEAENIGLDKETSVALLTQTLSGSAKMILESGKTPEELLRMVTSPHGTTEAANKVFNDGGYEELIKKAINACYQRSIELGKGIK